MEFTVSPPLGNTGAQNTSQTALRSCVDWLQATFKNVHNVQEIIQILGMELTDFTPCDSGQYGYKEQVRCGHIAIYFNGRENMGVHLEMTGQGCREYETMSIFSWSRLFCLFMNYDVNITRLDLAVDDFEGYFTLKQLKRKIRQGAVRSLFRSAMEIRKSSLDTGESKGDTIYFGSEKSRVRIRIYDKYLEMISKGRQLEEELTFWNRTELQFRDERANAVAYLIAIDKDSLGEIITGILKRYINFCVKSKDTNKARWKVCKFWTDFLGDVEPLKLTEIAPDRTVEDTKDWIQKQVEPSLSMLYVAFENDKTLMDKIVYEGLMKMKDKHFDMLERYMRKEGIKINTESLKEKVKQKQLEILGKIKTPATGTDAKQN